MSGKLPRHLWLWVLAFGVLAGLASAATGVADHPSGPGTECYERGVSAARHVYDDTGRPISRDEWTATQAGC